MVLPLLELLFYSYTNTNDATPLGSPEGVVVGKSCGNAPREYNTYMDDFAFKIPGKILKFLLIGAFLISILWGVFTWDSKKAMDLWTTQVTFITTPILNFFTGRIEKRMETVTESAFSQLATSTESGSN